MPIQYKIMIGISCLCYLVFVGLLLTTIIVGALNIRKLKQNPNKILVVSGGLNQKSILFPLFYYGHYIFI